MHDKYKVCLSESLSLVTPVVFSFLEIDIIIERPGLPRAVIEIKSKSTIGESDLRGLQSLGLDIPNGQCFCFSLDEIPKMINGIHCLHWQDGLKEIGLAS